MNPKILSAAKHFAFGLLAAMWNGGISSVAAILGIDAVAMTGATQENRVLNPHEMLSAFVGACLLHGVIWLRAHPLPEKYEDTTPPIP